MKLIFLLMCFSFYSYSQEYYYELNKIPHKGELSNFRGTAMLQDSKGFMWFGSLDGLYRYDGAHFKVYRLDLQDTTSLSNSFVNAIFEDSEGIIWVATDRGISRYYTESDSFQRIPNNANTSMSHTFICLEEYNKRIIWMGSVYGITKYDKETREITNFHKDDPDVILEEGIMEIKSTSEGNLLIQDLRGEKFKIFTRNDSLVKVGDIRGFPIYQDTLGIYKVDNWRSIEDDLSTAKESLRKNQLSGKDIWSSYSDSDQNIWIRTEKGIHCFNQNLDLIFYVPNFQSNIVLQQGDYMEREYTTHVYEDTNHSLWYFGEDGIYQIVRKKKIFNQYPLNLGWEITCMAPIDKDHIWVGNSMGVFKFDRTTKDYTNYSVIPGFGYLGWVRSMLLNSDNTLWVGTHSNGLFALNKDGQLIRHFKPVWHQDINKRRFFQPRQIFEDSQDRVWILSEWARPCYFDRDKDRVMFLASNPVADDDFEPKNIVTIIESSSGNLYVMGEAGFYKVVPPFIQVSDSTVMPRNIIKYNGKNQFGEIHEMNGEFSFLDNSGDIWMGFPGAEFVSRIIPDEETKDRLLKVINFFPGDGLINGPVHSFVQDHNNNIWMASAAGISKFNRATGNFTNYYQRQGLPTRFFNDATSLESGEVVMATFGLVIFHPDSLPINDFAAPVKITDLQINNESIKPSPGSVLEKSIEYTDSIELTYNQNNLSFSYALLNYINPDLNQYKYKLEGYHDEWIFAGNRTKVDFTNLDPGDYTFRIIAANEEGIWNEEGASLQIFIAAPWWKTTTAYVSYVLFVLISLYFIRRYELNRQSLRHRWELKQLETEKYKEIDQAKSKFFANISHEFRTPLTLIRGPLEELDKQQTENIPVKKDLIGIMKRNTARLQRLINQLLDISKMETGQMKLQVRKGDIEKFLRSIILSFLSLAESKNIHYSYEFPGENHLVLYDEDKLEKIVINLISNAFKFTPKNGKINIRCEYEYRKGAEDPELINISVEDTGRGIAEDKLDKIFDRFYQVNDSSKRDTEGTGIGLALTRELVKIYRGEISAESKEGIGSTFKLKLPVSELRFQDYELDPVTKKDSLSERESFQEQEETKNFIGKKLQTSKDKPLALIVEDNSDLRTYISGILGNNYRIQTAENGKLGYDMAVAKIPDIVISDLMMPVMDGVELCRMIKEDERTNHIPVIMLTAKADKGSKMEGLNTGADDYIIKPFDAEELHTRAKNLIDQRKKLRQKFRKDFILPKKTDITVSQNDRLIRKVFDLFEKNYSDFNFNVDDMSAELHMSRTQFYRKVHALTGESPNELFRVFRMKKAAELIKAGNSNITGVMYEVGFKSTSHFANSFKKYFGQNPSEYRNSLK
ncbi:ATP-binding protein [Maribellus mangrovi]|uniref:ATP-binding protein n=1 Tax=Maribellus mangrovi TaxID=3133146 RepID=UPI0030EBBAE0